MPESLKTLQQQLNALEEENRQLRESCRQRQEMQENLELIIGENNAKLLRAEMSSLELEQVFSACTDALWVIREDDIVVRANEAMLALLGKPHAEVIGQNCHNLLNYQQRNSTACPPTAAKSKLEFDIQITTASGETGDFILSTAPLVTLDGSPGIVGQFKDITSRKKAEDELAQANVSLERMVRIDGLTQIANRRCLDETMEKEWIRLSREKKPLSLLLGDIDFFKKFNDRYGHQAGDDCLKAVAKALNGTMFRPADLTARYGGEEFAMLLPGSNIDGALHVGERLITAIVQLAIEHQDSDVNPFVTISLGAATLLPSAEQTPQDLIALADKALYQAKESGRNRVVSA